MGALALKLLAPLAETVLPRLLDVLLERLQTHMGSPSVPPAQKPTPSLKLCAQVLAICQRYHCSVTSWYRTPSRNQLVGGLPTSAHLKALAFDIIPDDPTRYPVIETACKALGLKYYFDRDHAHISLPDPS